MVTWHPEEEVEMAALQLINTFFGVPQLSILLSEIPDDHLDMVRFYTQYWNSHWQIFLEGYFVPEKPLANYPIKRACLGNHEIIGVYDSYVVPVNIPSETVHILNAQSASQVVLQAIANYGTYHGIVYNCIGAKVSEISVALNTDPVAIPVPPCGIVQLEKKQSKI